MALLAEGKCWKEKILTSKLLESAKKAHGKSAKELKNNAGWGNKDMPENLVVELEASTMLVSQRGLKKL